MYLDVLYISVFGSRSIWWSARSQTDENSGTQLRHCSPSSKF